MTDELRAKFVQAGTGQVGYLYLDEANEEWAFDLFVGPPVVYQRTAEWPTRAEAESALAEMDFTGSHS